MNESEIQKQANDIIAGQIDKDRHNLEMGFSDCLHRHKVDITNPDTIEAIRELAKWVQLSLAKSAGEINVRAGLMEVAESKISSLTRELEIYKNLEAVIANAEIEEQANQHISGNWTISVRR